MKYLLLLTSVLLAVVGQILLKKGVVNSDLNTTFISITKTLFTPYVFTGFLLYGISSIIWLFVLKIFPLSTAYPALSLSYVLVVLLSFVIFKESVTTSKIIGIVFILTGVYVLFQ